MLMKVHRTATVLLLGICMPVGAARAEATKETQDLFIATCQQTTEASAPEFSAPQRQTFCLCKLNNLVSSLSNQELIILISSYRKADTIDLPQKIYNIDNNSSQSCF